MIKAVPAEVEEGSIPGEEDDVYDIYDTTKDFPLMILINYWAYWLITVVIFYGLFMFFFISCWDLIIAV